MDGVGEAVAVASATGAVAAVPSVNLRTSHEPAPNRRASPASSHLIKPRLFIERGDLLIMSFAKV
ncbi:hypothetical protein D3C71_1980190 [compost metagenome]